MRCFGDLGFEKLRHTPGNSEGHAHAQGCAHAQEGLEKASG